MRNQFDSCSYDELTSCLKARVEWIRESRLFLADPYTLKYEHVRAKTILSMAINADEIRLLLIIRRVLKRSKYRNWDSTNKDLVNGYVQAYMNAKGYKGCMSSRAVS